MSSPSWAVRLIDEGARDVRLACRSLRGTPVVTVVVVLSLALGIGANTAIFSLLNGLILRPLPVRDPSSLVHVTDSVLREDGETRVRAWSYPVWRQIAQKPDLFESATAWSFTRFNIASTTETQLVDGIWADGGFFDAWACGQFSVVPSRSSAMDAGSVSLDAIRPSSRSVRLNGVLFTIRA